MNAVQLHSKGSRRVCDPEDGRSAIPASSVIVCSALAKPPDAKVGNVDACGSDRALGPTGGSANFHNCVANQCIGDRTRDPEHISTVPRVGIQGGPGYLAPVAADATSAADKIGVAVATLFSSRTGAAGEDRRVHGLNASEIA